MLTFMCTLADHLDILSRLPSRSYHSRLQSADHSLEFIAGSVELNNYVTHVSVKSNCALARKRFMLA